MLLRVRYTRMLRACYAKPGTDLGYAAAPGVSILRIMRAFRILRLIGRFQKLKRIINAILVSIIPVLNAFLIGSGPARLVDPPSLPPSLSPSLPPSLPSSVLNAVLIGGGAHQGSVLRERVSCRVRTGGSEAGGRGEERRGEGRKGRKGEKGRRGESERARERQGEKGEGEKGRQGGLLCMLPRVLRAVRY
eukprot:3227775-Rhodomonas_salina.5